MSQDRVNTFIDSVVAGVFFLGLATWIVLDPPILIVWLGASIAYSID